MKNKMTLLTRIEGALTDCSLDIEQLNTSSPNTVPDGIIGQLQYLRGFFAGMIDTIQEKEKC